MEHQQIIELPEKAKILCVQIKDGIPNIWVKLNTSNFTQGRLLKLFGTGHQIDDNFKGKYIGSFQVNVNQVFHLFDCGTTY